MSRSRNKNLLLVVVSVILLSFIAFWVYYHQNEANDAYTWFMDGQSRSVRAMMVVLGVVIRDF